MMTVNSGITAGPIVPPTNSSSHMLDVTKVGCFVTYDEIACIRNGALLGVIFITGVVISHRLLRYHIVHHVMKHHYIVFYCALLECICCFTHMLLDSVYTQIDFFTHYLKLVQYLVIANFQCTFVLRILHKEHLQHWLASPVLLAYALYFTTICVIGASTIANSNADCLEPWWLCLSLGELSLVQIFLLLAYFIARKIRAVRTCDSVKHEQRVHLYLLLLTMEVSAVAGVAFDASLLLLADPGGRDVPDPSSTPVPSTLPPSPAAPCAQIFNYVQELYSPIVAALITLKFLAPIWVMLYTYQEMGAVRLEPPLLDAAADPAAGGGAPSMGGGDISGGYQAAPSHAVNIMSRWWGNQSAAHLLTSPVSPTSLPPITEELHHGSATSSSHSRGKAGTAVPYYGSTSPRVADLPGISGSAGSAQRYAAAGGLPPQQARLAGAATFSI